MHLDETAYEAALRRWRLRLAVTFDEGEHPRDQKGRFKGVAKTIKGKHGVSHGPIVGAFKNRDLYIGPEHVAGAYAEESGVVHDVEFKAKNALVLDTAEKAIAAWEASGVDQSGATRFHGGGEGWGDHFAQWAREQGYDAVEITPAAFFESDKHPGEPDPDVDWTDDVQKQWEFVAGTWGEPQTIILDPARAKIKAAKK